MSIVYIAFLILELLLIMFCVYLIWSWIMQTPFYPSSTRKLDRLMSEGKINIPESGKFIDIGSGDGRFVGWAAEKGYEAHGIEFNPFLSLWSKFFLFITGKRNRSKIFNKNFKNHDFSDYDVAYLYIFSEHMDQIKDKLFNEMKPGSAIITNTFKFSEVEPKQKVERFYVYEV